MQQKTFWLIACIAATIAAGAVSSCCLNCPNQSQEGKPAYSDENPPDPPLSGEVINGVRVIKMTAKRYEYNPSTITVNQGDKVLLEITSKDVTHGFGLKEYDINRRLEPGKTEVIEFTADKAGTFGFHCTVFCGIGHLGMRGKLIVEPK